MLNAAFNFFYNYIVTLFELFKNFYPLIYKKTKLFRKINACMVLRKLLYCINIRSQKECFPEFKMITLDIFFLVCFFVTAQLILHKSELILNEMVRIKIVRCSYGLYGRSSCWCQLYSNKLEQLPKE